ncbi:MAG: hypothetical protein PVI98_07405, partial [Burkholderiales bacterium]
MSVRRFLLWSAGGIVVLALAIAAVLYWASRSETFLRWGIDRIATSLPCVLRVEGLEGAFMKPVHIQHLICQNAEYRIEAHNVSLVWSPWMLTRRRLDVSSLDIGSLSYTSTSQGAGSSAVPTDIGLPIAIEVASLKIGTLSLQTGDQPLQLTAIDASYQGDAQSHRLKLRNLASEWGRANADATLGTAAPFPLTATLTVNSARLEDWPLEANIGFTGELLRQVNATFEATTRDIAANGNIELLPLQAQPVKSINATAATIDAAMFDQRLPHTALTVNIEGKPFDNGLLAGHVNAANALAGKLDEQRIPVQHLEANFALDTTTLSLTDLRLDLGKAGSADGTAILARDRATLSLQVRNFDLQAARNDLRQTSLNGAISLEHHDQRQLVKLDLKEKDMQLQGRAEITSQRVVIEHMRARAGGAQLQASATVQLDDALGFSLDGNLSRFDPARFGDFPEADINGNVQVSGRLRPQWFAQVRYKLSQSRLNGVALGGNGSFALTQTRLSAADAHIEYGGNNLNLTGSFGEP